MLVAAKCPNCGGNIRIDDNLNTGVCEFCKTTFYTSDVVYQNNNITNNYFENENKDKFSVLVEKLNAYIKISDYCKQIEIVDVLINEFPQKKESWYLYAKINTLCFSESFYEKVGNIYPANFIENKMKKCIHAIESLSEVKNDALAIELNDYYNKYIDSIERQKEVLEQERLKSISLVRDDLYTYFNGLHIEENDRYARPASTSGCNFFFVKNNVLYYRQGHTIHDSDDFVWLDGSEDITLFIDDLGYLCDSSTGEKYNFFEPKYGYIQIVAFKSGEVLLSNSFNSQVIHSITECNTCNYTYNEYYSPNGTYHILKTNYYSNYEYKPIKKKGCYIATCIYASYDCPEVWTLRRFRDMFLEKHVVGRGFIRLYYAISPHIVRKYGNKKVFKHYIKILLDKFVMWLKKKGYNDSQYYD